LRALLLITQISKMIKKISSLFSISNRWNRFVICVIRDSWTFQKSPFDRAISSADSAMAIGWDIV
jgi:hypothetical protein